MKIKQFKIEPIPADHEETDIEPGYYVTVDDRPVISLSHSEVKTLSALNYSEQRSWLLQKLDAERLHRFRKALDM